jgi:hypothetical protein
VTRGFGVGSGAVTTDDRHETDPAIVAGPPVPAAGDAAPAASTGSSAVADPSPGQAGVPGERAVPEEAAAPNEATLAAVATPAAVRRAPRIGAFVRTGVLLGAVVGWLLAILFTGTTGEGRTGSILLTTVGLAGFGALLGAGAAALADRRSTRAAAAGPRRRAAR